MLNPKLFASALSLLFLLLSSQEQSPSSVNASNSSGAVSDKAVEAELKRNTQALLDAIAPGNAAVWDKFLDPRAIQIDENDEVRDKPAILAELKPLGKGLVGRLEVDDFRSVIHGNVAVVTHEDKEYLDYYGQIIRSRFRLTDTWIKTPQGWRQIASQVLAVQQDPPAMKMDRTQLCKYQGRYSLTSEIVASIHCAEDRLIVQRPERTDRTLLPEASTVFFEPGQPRTRRIFQLNASGEVTGFVDRREGRDVVWKKIGEVIPK